MRMVPLRFVFSLFLVLVAEDEVVDASVAMVDLINWSIRLGKSCLKSPHCRSFLVAAMAQVVQEVVKVLVNSQDRMEDSLVDVHHSVDVLEDFHDCLEDVLDDFHDCLEVVLKDFQEKCSANAEAVGLSRCRRCLDPSLC